MENVSGIQGVRYDFVYMQGGGRKVKMIDWLGGIQYRTNRCHFLRCYSLQIAHISPIKVTENSLPTRQELVTDSQPVRLSLKSSFC